MNILFVTFYFPPEVGAPQRRIREFALELCKRGHQVSVLTGFPNYPHGELIPPYRRRLYLRENLDGIEVLRVFHFLGSRRGKLGRALAEGSFALSAAFAALLERAPDVVVVESPSLLSGWVGVVLKKLRQTPFVLHIADPLTAAAAGMGIIRGKAALKALSKMEDGFYQAADRTVTVSPGICRILHQQGLPVSKVTEIPNGVGDQYFEQLGRLEPSGNGGSKEIRVVYAGNHGLAQGLFTLLEAARLLLTEKSIRFLFYGDGIEKAELVRQAEGMRLENVIFLGPVMADRMADIFARTDIWMVPLADLPGLEWAIPSKLLEGMGAGRPVVLSARGESAKLVQQAEAGLVVEPGRPKLIADAIGWLHGNREQAKKMGENGRVFVGRNFLRSKLADKLEAVLNGVIEENRRLK